MRSKTAFKNITISLLLQAIIIICGFIVPKLIIDHFGSDTNGLVTSITQFLAYITLLESGIGPVIKARLYKPLAKHDKTTIANILYASEKFFKRLAVIFVLYVAMLCFIYPLIVAKEFEFSFTVSLLLIIAISTFAEYYFGMTYKLYLQATQRTYIASYFQIGATVLNTLGIVLLIGLGYNILLVKLLSGLIFVIRPLLQNWYVKKKYHLSFTNVDKEYVLEQKWDGLAQHIAAVVHGNTDVVVLTLFANIAEVSVYSVYMLVINGIKRIVEALTGGIDAAFGDMIAKKEDETLRKSFGMYEFFYYSLITILFNCTMLLILPFVQLYTAGVTDADYSRPLFAILITLAAFAHSIRLPYSTITLAAGHFKQTMKGAWVEALVNIVLSVILVFRFGLIGVAIGTLIAMVIRTAEFSYHASKYILKRNVIDSIKKIAFILVETAIIFCLFTFVLPLRASGYGEWISNAVVILGGACTIVFAGNIFCYWQDVKDFRKLIKKLFARKEKNPHA